MIPVSDFKFLFEEAPGLYLILAPDFTIVAVSDAYAEATMTKRAEIVGRGLFEVFPDNPDDQNADGVSNLRASLNIVLKSKELHRMHIQKYDIRRPDGTFEERYWTPMNKPVLDQEKNIKYIIHRAEDVTEFVKMQKENSLKEKLTEDLQKRTNEMELEIFLRSEEIKKINIELEQNVSQLEIVNKELSAFTYSVSHDLRSPLRAIDGYSKMLEEDYGTILDKEGHRMLGMIHYNAKRMGTLIDDLLVFSRLGRKEIQKSHVDMKLVAEEALLEAKKTSEDVQHVKIGKLDAALADYSLMKQVFINLISNGLKYSSKKEHPLIEVNSQKKENEILYSVKDNGVGFEMQYVHKLFGVFQRLHSQEEFEGTGVGLAIVQRIVNKHGGTIWAEAEQGKGAIFYFTLPI